MDAAWLDDYISAWVLHPRAGSPGGADALTDLLKFMSPNVEYKDVPTGLVWVGHDGVKEMSTGAHQWSADLSFTVHTRQTNGSLFALECEVAGTNTGDFGAVRATGRRFALWGVSVGTVSREGLVQEHRDYWDMPGFMAQIGATPASS
ncbi:MAG TPA: ester cyclase [Acidimicrobiales bacterium]|nr:ester cyclase [Acidimicrobiales bacterium]